MRFSKIHRWGGGGCRIKKQLGNTVINPVNQTITAIRVRTIIFRIIGTVAMVWSIVWLAYVGESPAEDARISEEEREHIIGSIGPTGVKTSTPVFHTYQYYSSAFFYRKVLFKKKKLKKVGSRRKKDRSPGPKGLQALKALKDPKSLRA